MILVSSFLLSPYPPPQHTHSRAQAHPASSPCPPPVVPEPGTLPVLRCPWGRLSAWWKDRALKGREGGQAASRVLRFCQEPTLGSVAGPVLCGVCKGIRGLGRAVSTSVVRGKLEASGSCDAGRGPSQVRADSLPGLPPALPAAEKQGRERAEGS